MEASIRRFDIWGGRITLKLSNQDTEASVQSAMLLLGHIIRRRKHLRTGTVAPRRRLDGVRSAGHICQKGPATGVAAMGQEKPMTAIVIAFIRKAVRMVVDIVEIKSAVRSGEITVYEEAGSLYIENTAGERIELKPKGCISRREEDDTHELAERSNQ